MRRSAIIVTLAFVAAACSSATESGKPSAASATFPVTVTASNGAVAIPARPTRIVSLSATATEMLFAIGAGAQVVAVDSTSNYPTHAPTTTLSAFQPNVEAIASYRPDLVVFSDDINQLGSSLKALNIPAIQQPAADTLDDSYTQITQLGEATGHRSEATTFVDGMRRQIREIVEGASTFTAQLTYYHELDSTFYSATSATFIGRVYGMLKLRNIADPADKPDNHYPQLSPEFIVQADPDLIFLADTKCCGQNRDSVAKRPGWGGIAAVRNGGVVALDDDVASRWGPRIVDFLRTAADALRALETAA